MVVQFDFEGREQKARESVRKRDIVLRSYRENSPHLLFVRRRRPSDSMSRRPREKSVEAAGWPATSERQPGAVLPAPLHSDPVLQRTPTGLYLW